MNPEQLEETTRDVSLPAACAACQGEVLVRLTPGRARGVCLACHFVSDLGLARGPDGVHIIQLPRAAA
ncbi:MAG TPA: hypothetical protein VEM76_11080 [Anaeromyxobacteraceae bacterium]|nr:hypothetical protein [Anaeromyxobacteraceae bacterium]